MIPLKPEHCAAAYDFLRAFPPFDKWRLPPAEAVEFRVKHLQDTYGEYRCEGRHVLTVSSALVSLPMTLIRVVAHEMVHLKQNMDGEETKSQHNAAFRRHAAKIAKLHGLDPKEF